MIFWVTSDGVLQKHMDKTINVIPATCSLTSKVNYETQQYPKGRKKSLNEKSQSDLESPSKVQRSQSSAEVRIINNVLQLTLKLYKTNVICRVLTFLFLFTFSSHTEYVKRESIVIA